MTQDISVDLDRLRQHAALVTSLADDVTSVISTLRGGDLASNAFGLLCAFLVPPSMAMSAAATGLFGADQSLLMRTAGELRQTADQWEQYEDDTINTLRNLETAMGL
ncbi:type VII secretion target [Microbacterium sp. NPDC089189]|uniref:type VII secretion target n=1 Tax=Microbacterium sp. NPDC089189 TaxID=3154972 RepID=UPI003445F0B4